MYGKTNYNRLSSFVREEVPDTLILREGSRQLPKGARGYYTDVNSSSYDFGRANIFREDKNKYSEFNRRPDIFNKKTDKTTASSFGVEKLESGTRVLHSIFGEGVILSAKDMGGDVLYEVKFDTGVTKKLMATFAKLKKL
jgi:DNA helicase-2/ATP-dependent DNA helicase PcrA